ncbi:hypothetical protein [Brooklawnia sp.]|uniref:hypothetical protein n=1 Tax=Brooklawnia sp. TaxID=2699740 RepID=UPI00311EBCA6
MADRAMHKLTKDEIVELRKVLGARPDVLVSARGPQAFVALLRDRLVVRREQGWQFVAWADVQRGGWDSDNRRLYWELVDGTRSEVELNQSSALPHAFAERVRASIVVSRQFQLDDDLGTVLIVGRRQPGSDDPISWQAEGLGRCDLTDPRVQSIVLGLVEDVRAEYE